MAKHPGLRRRGNTFSICRAIPKELRGKGPYVTKSGRPKTEIVRKLGTSDPKEARRRVHEEWALLDREFETERFKLANPHLESRELAARVRELGRGALKTVSLRDLDARTEAFRYFIELEKDSEESISELVARCDEDKLREILADVRAEAADLVGASRGLGDSDGFRDLSDYLERKGLTIDLASEGLQKFADWFRRARLENLRRDINRLQRLPATEGDPDFRDSFAMAYRGPLRADSAPLPGMQKTVGELVTAFLSHAEKTNLSPGTLRTYKTPVRLLRGYFGPGRALGTITIEDVMAMFDFLETYPKNAWQRYPGLTIQEAARAAKKAGDEERLSVKAMRSTRLTVSTIFSHAMNLGWIESNPAKGKLLSDRFKERRKTPKKAQFTAEEMNQLFAAPLYTGCQNDLGGYNRPGPNRPRRGRFWVPLLALFHGMRLNECCQLLVTDIAREDGVDVIRVTLGDSDAETVAKRLKTGASERTVPIHPELKRIGFLEFVEERRRKGDSERLFPELPASRDGYLSDIFSKWFARFVSQSVGKKCRARFHSFRHMFRDALRRAGTSEERVNAIQGWEAGSGMQAHYGQGFDASTLFEEIEKVTYPGLDLSHLYPDGAGD